MKTHTAVLEQLGDFTANRRMLLLSLIAVLIGLVSTLVAWILMRLIGFFTNLLYYGRIDFALTSPAGNHLGWLSVLVPILGGLVVGIMARYGSERIRGHGIPEALESILLNGSRIAPRVAVLKPISSALAIGSGGPFGAEGPIIMTGGAFGSIFAQMLQLTSVERKTLLVAGAAAGMAATFAAPVASVLLAVELLLFEFKPRSAVPVALACATAGVGRRYLLGLGPLFPVPPHTVMLGGAGFAGCVLCGLFAGLLSIALTKGMYAVEDLFGKLPVHWMWWPAIGGAVVGLGGMVFPQALGVGYDTIGAMLQGDVPRAVIAGVLIVKSTIWIVALGSGTSGGILAPLLMMGAALGGVEGMFLPHYGAGFWPLVSMAAVLVGAMGAPLTGIIFALELTHDMSVLVPLLIAGMVSYAISVLTLKRSILTEKIARRGLHLSREYSIDPLEILFARDVMRTTVVTLSASATLKEVLEKAATDSAPRGQFLFPVLDDNGALAGVVTRRDLLAFAAGGEGPGAPEAIAGIIRQPVIVSADEPLRIVAARMAATGLTRMPVVDDAGRFEGMVAVFDLLRARAHNLDEEEKRERVLRWKLKFRFHQNPVQESRVQESGVQESGVLSSSMRQE